MDVTEDLHNAWAVKPDRSNLMFRIATQVEAFGTRKRKHVMEERISVGKIDGGPANDWEYVWNKGLVGLQNHRVRLWGIVRIREPSFKIQDNILKLIRWQLRFLTCGRDCPARIKVEG